MDKRLLVVKYPELGYDDVCCVFNINTKQIYQAIVIIEERRDEYFKKEQEGEALSIDYSLSDYLAEALEDSKIEYEFVDFDEV